jgi:predicted transcriptional regulator
MTIQVNIENLSFFECFASATRLRIIQLLNERPMNIKELAEKLETSSAIVTKHIQKMEQYDVVESRMVSGTRGRSKVCRIKLTSVLLQFKISKPLDLNQYSVAIPIGQYSSYQVHPTCGLASETSMIGITDDPRYFSDPDHVKARHLWFTNGYVEYRIPNYLVGKQTLRSISFTFEICSEAPGYIEDWPSDITFYVNHIDVGTWTSPGDFGANKGLYTPEWWNKGTQYGLLKTITIRPEGTFVDGVKLSTVTSSDISPSVREDFYFRIACLDTAEHSGGVNLFGKQFGNYDQDIEVNISYDRP